MCRKLGVTEQTYYRWKKEYGGLRLDQAKRLKELEGENARLKRLLADADLDKAILREAASGNFQARRSGGKQSLMCETLSGMSGCRNAGCVVCQVNRAAASDGVGTFAVTNRA